MECRTASDGSFSLMIITRAWHAPVDNTEGELLNVKPRMYRQMGGLMIRQPKYGSRNVNDTYYRFEARMIEKLNAVLGDIELTKAEERTLIWLAGWEECTIDHLVSVIEKVARKQAEEVGGNAQDKEQCHERP